MTRPDQDSPRDLAAAYALGALSPDEAARFEAYLATSAEARRDVSDYREVATLLALGGPESAPGGALRDRVLARIGARSARPQPSAGHASGGGAREYGLWVALAASLLLVMGLGAAALSTGRQLAAAKQLAASAGQQLAERDATLDAILAPGVQLVQLTASGDPEPGIQLFWDRQRHRAIVNGYRLRPVAPGKAYQLWFIKDGKPVPSVTFKPAPDGRASVGTVPVPGDGSISAAAVTVEPEAGSPQPTSPILLVGTLPKS
jgi:anti-sigma-K factor RskA